MFHRQKSEKRTITGDAVDAVERGISMILNGCGFHKSSDYIANIIVIFGASVRRRFGKENDLSRSLVIINLELYKVNLMPKNLVIYGFARSALNVDKIRDQISEFIEVQENEKAAFETFWKINHYFQGNYETAADYKSLDRTLDKLENCGISNRLFYLALPPHTFEVVTTNIHSQILSTNGWNRIVVEKPFGKDSTSAEKLSGHLTKLFKEDTLYRMDHYLGKEMVQNLIALRFANPIFSNTWDRSNIASVMITLKEPFGVNARGAYFDNYGIIRDVIQNHLLQVACLVAMERPVTTSAEDIRNEKVRVLRSAAEIKIEDVVVGQYVGNEKGDDVSKVGYREDATVPKDSLTATFASVVLKINNERWEGVPFILKCGKAMNEHKSEVRIQYRNPAGDIFDGKSVRNELVIRVQPNEAIYLKLMMKSPGMTFDVHETELDLNYNDRYKDVVLPDAYKRLILDVLTGSQTHFVRSDELKEAWRIFTPVLHHLETEKVVPIEYTFGARGLKEADELSRRHNFVYTGKYQWQKSKTGD
ncbi:glucose-6-phosphate dehydrogenase-like protein [Leptotrombidium deliense]|uniref:Glucose-6-phosphate 1-dehydrogenase n=1 Tax=Leptotrombidium deliense TaxID=299467 RepID=A0A443S8W5_9ACAR|nr:glucose-6-phosphate dehydrogenase-like protein [Leptotrombidium deliense]